MSLESILLRAAVKRHQQKSRHRPGTWHGRELLRAPCAQLGATQWPQEAALASAQPGGQVHRRLLVRDTWCEAQPVRRGPARPLSPTTAAGTALTRPASCRRRWPPPPAPGRRASAPQPGSGTGWWWHPGACTGRWLENVQRVLERKKEVRLASPPSLTVPLSPRHVQPREFPPWPAWLSG